MRSFLKNLLVPSFILAFSALALQACSGDGENQAGTCVPNSTQACLCAETGKMGVQTCQASGIFNTCQCGGGMGGSGGGTASSSSSSSSGGDCHALPNTPATCGNGQKDPGEECDDGDCDATDECNNDCRLPYCGDKVIQPPETCDGGEQCPPGCGVPSSSSSSSSSSGNACAGKLVFAGESSMGATNGHWQYNGQDGLAAAKAACTAVNGFGVCDYDQWEQIKNDPVMYALDVAKLVALIPTGTSKIFWLHRTTDVPGDPAGPGGRCNDWFYPTDHLADGEYVTITNNAGTLSFAYTLDPDTVYDANMPAPHQNAGIPCGAMRIVPCCYQKCVP